MLPSALNPKIPGLIRLLKPSQPVPSNWHEDFIVHIASVVRPKVYMELGLYRCELFNRIIPYAETLIGLDIVPEVGNYMRKSSKTTFVCKNTEEYGKEFTKNPMPIDLLFIDADHSEEWVKKDFDAFFPYISDQGMILLHDGYPKNEEQTSSGYCGDGYKAIEKLTKKAAEAGYEMMTIPVHPGLTLCRKRSKHLAWK